MDNTSKLSYLFIFIYDRIVILREAKVLPGCPILSRFCEWVGSTHTHQKIAV